MNLSPNATASHWTAEYVGRPWTEDFNCWHLVQEVQRNEFLRLLPDIEVGTPADQTSTLLAVTQGWARTQGPGRDGDVITMVGSDGPHVGVVVKGRVLHNVGGVEEGKPWGSVRLDTFDALGHMGFGHLKLWRAL